MGHLLARNACMPDAVCKSPKQLPKLPLPLPPNRTASVQSPLGASAAADPAAARPAHATTAPLPAPPKQGPAGTPVTSSGRRFVSYCVQKLSSSKANHAAFWIQDEAGDSLLAVVVSWALHRLQLAALTSC